MLSRRKAVERNPTRAMQSQTANHESGHCRRKHQLRERFHTRFLSYIHALDDPDIKTAEAGSVGSAELCGLCRRVRRGQVLRAIQHWLSYRSNIRYYAPRYLGFVRLPFPPLPLQHDEKLIGLHQHRAMDRRNSRRSSRSGSPYPTNVQERRLL